MQRRCAGRGISLPLRGRVLPRGATCRAHRRRQLARYVIAVRCKKSTRLELSRRRSKPMLASRRTTIDQRCGHGGQRGAGAGPELGAAAGCPQHGARRAWGGAAHHRGEGRLSLSHHPRGAPRHHHARPSGNALNGPRDFSGERRQRPATRDADARLFLCPKLCRLGCTELSSSWTSAASRGDRGLVRTKSAYSARSSRPSSINHAVRFSVVFFLRTFMVPLPGILAVARL